MANNSAKNDATARNDARNLEESFYLSIGWNSEVFSDIRLNIVEEVRGRSCDSFSLHHIHIQSFVLDFEVPIKASARFFIKRFT